MVHQVLYYDIVQWNIFIGLIKKVIYQKRDIALTISQRGQINFLMEPISQVWAEDSIVINIPVRSSNNLNISNINTITPNSTPLTTL